MKKGGLFLFILFFCFPVLAQTEMDMVFKKDNPNMMMQNEAQSFTGSPLVYLEGVSDKPQPKTWQDKLKMRLFGSMEIPKNQNEPELDATPSFLPPSQDSVEIRPAFGPTRQVANVPHTADWTFVMTPSDSNLVDIYENMVFILTEKTENIIRDWPVSEKDFRLIQAKIDGLPLQLKQDSKSVFIQFPVLNPGVHTLRLNYIVPFNQNKIPLIGQNWPLLADRFFGVLYFNNLNFDKLTFLIGTNEKEFPENFKIQKDKRGNVFFQLTKVLPPKTQVQLNLPQEKGVYSSNDSSLTFFWTFMGILFLYILCSCLEIKYMPLEKKLKKFKFYSLNPVLNFGHRFGELCFGTMLLFLLMGAIAWCFNLSLSIALWEILILENILILGMADYFIFRPAQRQIYQMRLNAQKEKQ